MLHKGASTQRHNQQVLAKPCHNPSDRDQQAREKLQQKVKIRSQAYIQLGEETLKTVHRTFQPEVPVILHLPALTDGSLSSKSTSTPTLFVIQEDLNCLEMTDDSGPPQVTYEPQQPIATSTPRATSTENPEISTEAYRQILPGMSS